MSKEELKESEKIVSVIADGKRIGGVPIGKKKELQKYFGLAGITFENWEGKCFSSHDIQLYWASRARW